jgi:glutamine synthetase
MGKRAILSPVADLNAVGNGTHIHFSLRDANGWPVMHDPSRPYGLSEMAEPFVAGILNHLPALAALTAPSIVSYFRLRPNRWAPVWANLAERDRGASLRTCAVIAAAAEDAGHQFNVEYRVCDATASPYMALGAIVHAGVDGIRKGMKLGAPPPKTIWEMTEEQRRELGIASLPGSLAQALDLMEASETVHRWFSPQFFDVYLRLRRSEITALRDLSDEAICSRYAAAY